MSNWGPAALIVIGYLISILFRFKLTDQTNRRIDDLRSEFNNLRPDFKTLRDELKKESLSTSKA